MTTRLVIFGVVTVLAAVSLPGELLWLILAPVVLMLKGRLSQALTMATVVGLLAEPFSPWRLGALTLLLLVSVSLTEGVLTRFLSASKVTLPLVGFSLASLIFSLPAMVISGAIVPAVIGILKTAVSGAVIFYLLASSQSFGKLINPWKLSKST